MAYFPPTGSIVAFQSDPSKLQASVTGTVNIGTQSGSVVAFPTGNQSVSGTVGASVIGLTPVAVTNIPSVSGTVLVGNLPVTQNVSGSVVAFQGAGWSGSVAATVTNFPTQSGSVISFQGGAWSTSVMTNVITSIATAGQVMGSVAALQGTSPWNMAGSVAAFQSGTWSPSALGYALRNDAIASTLGADLTYGPISRDSAGRQLYKPFAAEEAVLRGNGSVNGAASIQLLAAGGTGLKTYLTDVTVVNTGAATTLVTFTDGDASVIGRTIAPAGGGSNIIGLDVPMVTMKTNTPINMVAATATSVLYGAAYGYKAP